MTQLNSENKKEKVIQDRLHLFVYNSKVLFIKLDSRMQTKLMTSLSGIPFTLWKTGKSIVLFRYTNGCKCSNHKNRESRKPNQKFMTFRKSQLNRCQFHQCFYVRIFRTNVISAPFSRYILALNKLSYEKCARIMLMKLTAGVNFTNVLCGLNQNCKITVTNNINKYYPECLSDLDWQSKAS